MRRQQRTRTSTYSVQRYKGRRAYFEKEDQEKWNRLLESLRSLVGRAEVRLITVSEGPIPA